MKTIYQSNPELIKVFNKQSQHYGKANSLFFEGNTLYSYGYHYPLALFIEPDTILLNDTGYSNTTARHISHARNITSNRKQIPTSEIELRQVFARLSELERKLQRARKPEIYTKQISDLYFQFTNNMKYLNGFYIKVKSMFSGTRFEYVGYSSATKEQKEILDNINSIYENSLCYA